MNALALLTIVRLSTAALAVAPAFATAIRDALHETHGRWRLRGAPAVRAALLILAAGTPG